MSGPTSSYAPASIALGISGALKPYHHVKVKIPSVGIHFFRIEIFKVPSTTRFSISNFSPGFERQMTD
jgi:hypothetical protein